MRWIRPPPLCGCVTLLDPCNLKTEEVVREHHDPAAPTTTETTLRRDERVELLAIDESGLAVQGVAGSARIPVELF